MTAEIFDASYLQESLYRSAKNGESAVNVGVVLRIHGPLDVPRLLAAISRLSSRHEALRTTLTSVNGKVCQVVAPPGEVPAVVLDLSAERDPEAEAMRLIKDHLRRPFALRGPSLCRVIITTCGPGVHFLAFSLHHAVMDGWSAGVLTADLRACYGDTGASRSPRRCSSPLTTRPGNGRPPTRRRWMAGESGCAGTAPGPGFPVRPAPAPSSSASPANCRTAVPMRLRASNGSPGNSGFPWWRCSTAAVVASLRDYVGDGAAVEGSGMSEPGLSIGLVRANRERAELRDVVGYLADIAPLTIDPRGDPEFSSLVGRAAEAVAYSRDHPVPLAALSGLLRTGSGEGPLFDVCLNYLPAGPPQEQADGELLMTNVDIKDEEASASRWWDGTALIDYVLRPAT